ncbi:hypothetical protein ACFLZG_06185 [Thermodesulfobacteriota bacterium]
MSLKMSLIDNDYVVRSETNFALEGKDDKFSGFLKKINDDLVIGETAYLEIEGSEMGPVKFEISKFE